MTDPVIAALRQRVQISEDPAMSALAPRLRPARVTVTLTDGRQATHSRDSHRGDFSEPFAEAEIRAKFRELAGTVLTEDGRTRGRARRRSHRGMGRHRRIDRAAAPLRTRLTLFEPTAGAASSIDELHRVAAAVGVAPEMAGDMDRAPARGGEKLAERRLGGAERDRVEARGARSPDPAASASVQRRWPVPTGSTCASADRGKGEARLGIGGAERRQRVDMRRSARRLRRQRDSAPSIDSSGTSRSRSMPSPSRSARNARNASSRSAATVKPAAIAWPPPLTSSPAWRAAITAGPSANPGTERPEPLPMPSASATTQAGRS